MKIFLTAVFLLSHFAANAQITSLFQPGESEIDQLYVSIRDNQGIEQLNAALAGLDSSESSLDGDDTPLVAQPRSWWQRLMNPSEPSLRPPSAEEEKELKRKTQERLDHVMALSHDILAVFDLLIGHGEGLKIYLSDHIHAHDHIEEIMQDFIGSDKKDMPFYLREALRLLLIESAIRYPYLESLKLRQLSPIQDTRFLEAHIQWIKNQDPNNTDIWKNSHPWMQYLINADYHNDSSTQAMAEIPYLFWVPSLPDTPLAPASHIYPSLSSDARFDFWLQQLPQHPEFLSLIIEELGAHDRINFKPVLLALYEHETSLSFKQKQRIRDIVVSKKYSGQVLSTWPLLYHSVEWPKTNSLLPPPPMGPNVYSLSPDTPRPSENRGSIPPEGAQILSFPKSCRSLF